MRDAIFFMMGVAAGALVMAVFTSVTLLKTVPIWEKIQEQITQCEEALPRNQHCEYKITAYIVESEE